MNLEPATLDIPLKRKNCLGLWLVAACLLAAALACMADVWFASAFLAACIVFLPALWLFFALPPVPDTFIARVPTFLRYLLLLGYFAIAKSMLMPVVLQWIPPLGRSG